MYELMAVRAHSPAPPIPVVDTMILKLTKSPSASTISFNGTKVMGEVTFDVASTPTTFSTSTTPTSFNVTIPANTQYAYVRVVVNPTGTGSPLFQTDSNTRITEVVSWDQVSSDVRLKFQQSYSLIVLPLQKPNFNNFDNFLNSCTAFNQDISMWDMSQATNLTSMFANCAEFNKSIAAWNVGNVTVMQRMFQSSPKFNQNISNLTFPKVTVANRQFYDLSASAWQTVNKPNFAIK